MGLGQTTIEAVVSRLIERCPACGRRPDLFFGHNADGSAAISAYCHGSSEYLVVSNGRRDRPETVGDKIAQWVRGLFKADALPDMRELLAYNAGNLPRAA